MLSKATSSSIVKPIPPALEVKNVCKAYTRNKPILLNVNMTVSQGEIYGLLGASGCGKTTILSCIAGIQEVDSGNIIPFGNPNLKKLKQVLGYMPQETTLYEFLTVEETLQFFGRVFGMAEIEIDHQIEYFCELLKLPIANYKIKDLSGGERRRSSLAACLIHSPKLLLLDEPTVGLDPVIRERIWNYLQQLTTRKTTTVIFSTHYIEEVRNSDKIGLLRDGRIIIERSPGQLLDKYKATFLEEVVLKLYKDDLISNDLPNRITINDKINSGKMRSFTTPQNEITCLSFTKTSQFEYLEEISVGEQNEGIYKTRKESFNIQLGRIKAVTIKNFLNFYRNPIFITALILLPVLQIIVTALFIGPLPKNMKLGVVNQELPHVKERCFNKLNKSEVFCGAGFSCLFLNQLSLPNENFFELVQIQFEEEAKDQVRLGKLWGYISIPGNYSEYFTLRGAQGLLAERMTLERSIIKVKLDMSEYLAGVLMYSNILKAFTTYTKDISELCGDNPRKYDLPMNIKSVFGNEGVTYMEYIIPSSLILTINMLVHGICSVSIITDRKYGMIGRSKVAGVQSTDIIIGYFVTEATPVFLQSAIGTGILIFGFNLQIHGSIAVFVLICILSGLCGQASGFLAGNILKDEMEAIFTGIFLFMPMLLLVGAIWPLEAMPSILRQISQCLPLTLACESLRSVTSRGLSFTHVKVWPGIAMLSGWTLIFWIIAYFLLKTSKTK